MALIDLLLMLLGLDGGDDPTVVTDDDKKGTWDPGG